MCTSLSAAMACKQLVRSCMLSKQMHCLQISTRREITYMKNDWININQLSIHVIRWCEQATTKGRNMRLLRFKIITVTHARNPEFKKEILTSKQHSTNHHTWPYDLTAFSTARCTVLILHHLLVLLNFVLLSSSISSVDIQVFVPRQFEVRNSPLLKQAHSFVLSIRTGFKQVACTYNWSRLSRYWLPVDT